LFDVTVSARANKEIENAIEYYALYSAKAPLHFIDGLQKAFDGLKQNPFHRVRYKNVRACNLEKFPYSLYYTVDENKKTVRVLACFHNKRNPKKRPWV
jgi:plasmid stabilization system protein ParE